MVLDSTQVKNLHCVEYTPIDKTGVPTTTTIDTGIGQGGEQPLNIDQLQQGNTVEKEQSKQKRTITELYNSINEICVTNGISIIEAKNIGLLSSISGKTEDELLNAEQTEINKIVEHIKATITALKEDNIEINLNNLEKYSREYNIVIQKGKWDSITKFRTANKQNDDDIIERLYRFRTGKDLSEEQLAIEREKFKNLSTEEKAKKLEAYFSTYFNNQEKEKIQKATSPEAAEKIKETVRTKQIQDFTKLIFNTNEDDRILFSDAIEYLAAKNRLEGFNALIESCQNEEEQLKIKQSMTYDKVQRIQTRADGFDDRMDRADITKFTASILDGNTKEWTLEYHEAATTSALNFYTEDHVAKLEKIYTKIQNGETLTEEEQELLAKDNHYKGDNAGQIIGVGRNENLKDADKIGLLNTINSDAYKIGEKAGNNFYREVITGVTEYARNLPEEAKAEFVTLMEKTIGENYTKVLNDIANGTTTELTQPTTNISTNNTTVVQSAQVKQTNNTYPGLTTRPTPANTNNTERVAQLYSQTKNNEETPTKKTDSTETIEISSTSEIGNYFEVYGTTKGYTEYAKKHGQVKAMIDTFTKYSENIGAMLRAQFGFKNSNSSQQVNVITQLYGTGLTEALELAKNNTIAKLDGKTFNSYEATQKVEEAVEERQKAIA